MKCPNCDHLLLITERQNVEIDYCPSCRGVWLDKGELDKIIAFSNQQITLLSKKSSDDDNNETISKYVGNEKNESKYADFRNAPKGHYKKKSFLGDLFDFD